MCPSEGRGFQKFRFKRSTEVGKPRRKRSLSSWTVALHLRHGSYASKNLKDNSPYNNPIYLNPSLCREFSYLNFLVRKAAKGKRVARWKVKKGITLVKISENDPKFHEITHRIVLIDLGIYDVIPDARGNPIIVKVINSPVRSYIFIMYHSA